MPQSEDSVKEPQQEVPLFKTKDKCKTCGVPYTNGQHTFCGRADCPTKPDVLDGSIGR